jgi:hypothetical protein
MVDLQGLQMTQDVICTPTRPVSFCNLSASLLSIDSSDRFTVPFSVAPTGAVALENIPDTGTVVGNVSSDGRYAVFAPSNASGGDIVLATRQGFFNTELLREGATYRLVVIGDALNTLGTVATFFDVGQLTINPACPSCTLVRDATITVQVYGSVTSRGLRCLVDSPAFCDVTAGSEPGSMGFTTPFSFISNGTFTLNESILGTITGMISQDGSLIVVTNSVDNRTAGGVGPLSRRFIGVAVKQP